MEAVHVDCGLFITLTCGIRDRERRPQLESHTWSVQVTCLIVVEDIMRASGGRIKIVGMVICEGSKGERIGIKHGWSESPVVVLAKARIVLFVCVLVAELSRVKSKSTLLVD